MTPDEGETEPRSGRSLAVLLSLGGLVVLVLLGLGVWQVQRLFWKLDLIARVDARVHAASTMPPGPAEWASVTAAADEYRHVAVTGTLLNKDETLVQAVTDLGPGFWVLTPLRTAEGVTVLINRGFVPPEKRNPASRVNPGDDGPRTIVGLLRITEPKGGFLRSNDPAAGRWYSRDVAAIAAAHGLDGVAPYFIDQDATRELSGYPVGGLTVVAFRNAHLVYAITWFVLAGMLAGALVWVLRDERRRTLRLGELSSMPR